MHPLFTQYQQTLFGRLKTKLLTQLTGSLDIFPSDREIWEFLMDRWNENAKDAEFLFYLLHCKRVNQIEIPARFSARSVEDIFVRAKKYGLIRRHSAEGRMHGVDGNPRFGCTLLGHLTTENRLGYYAVMYSEDAFPEAYAGFVSIVVGNGPADSRLDTLGHDGWQQFTFATASERPEIRAALATIRDVLDRSQPIRVHRSQVQLAPAAFAPEDKEFMRRVNLVYRGRMPVHLGLVNIQHIRPYDLDFCATIDSRLIESFVDAIQCKRWPTLVVYRRENSYMMSDDYCTYLAYRQLGHNEVRVAIMGDYVSDLTSIIKSGGDELMPPFTLTPVPRDVPEADEYKEWLLDQRLQRADKKPLPADWLACWASFANALGDDDLSEAEVHKFLLKYPVVLNAYGSTVVSEIWLGNRYRIDLIVTSGGLLDAVQLVELENPNLVLFTKAGRPSAKITHAKQQVEDWLRWWRENPEQRPENLRGAVEPRGLVIVGKSRDLTDEQRRILAHLNQGSDVQIITYDEVLEQFRTLTLTRVDDSRDMLKTV